MGLKLRATTSGLSRRPNGLRDLAVGQLLTAPRAGPKGWEHIFARCTVIRIDRDLSQKLLRELYSHRIERRYRSSPTRQYHTITGACLQQI